MTVYAYGDSITFNELWCDNDWCIPRAFPGETTRDGLARLYAELPDIPQGSYVVLGWGANHVRKMPFVPYVSDIRDAAEAVLDAGSVPVLWVPMGMYYPDSFPHDPVRLEFVDHQILEYTLHDLYDVADDLDIPIADHFDNFLGHPEYYTDWIHPGELGQPVIEAEVLPEPDFGLSLVTALILLSLVSTKKILRKAKDDF